MGSEGTLQQQMMLQEAKQVSENNTAVYKKEEEPSMNISDLISSQLAQVDSYLELKKREMENVSELENAQAYEIKKGREQPP